MKTRGHCKGKKGVLSSLSPSQSLLSKSKFLTTPISQKLLQKRVVAIKKSVFLLTSAPSINRRREAEASNESNLPFLGRNSITPVSLALLGERPARLESLPSTRAMLLPYLGEEAFSTFHTLSTKALKLLFQQFSPSSLMAIFFLPIAQAKNFGPSKQLFSSSHILHLTGQPITFKDPVSSHHLHFYSHPYLNHCVISYGSCVPSSCLSAHLLQDIAKISTRIIMQKFRLDNVEGRIMPL